MRSHIPTLELDPYELTILVSFCLSSFSLASWLHTRWLLDTKVDFFRVYFALLASIVMGGFWLIGWRWSFDVSAGWIAFSLPAGAGLGLLAERLDRRIVRRLLRRTGLRPATPHSVNVQGRTHIVSQTPPVVQRKNRGLRTIKSHQVTAEALRPTLALMLCIAALEELIFRGLLLQLAELSPSLWVYGTFVVGTLVVFACSHIQFGWAHVFGKAPLGALCLLVTLVSGSVVGAIVAHAFFNFRAFTAIRNQSVTATPPESTVRISNQIHYKQECR